MSRLIPRAALAATFSFLGAFAASAATVTVMHDFGSVPDDGNRPIGTLAIDRFGNLFGVTQLGGGGGSGNGIVYSMTRSGYYFIARRLGPDDGINPFGGLTLDKAGNVWGTALRGGANNSGTVFQMSSTAFTVKYAFTGTEGNQPGTPLLIDPNGNVWGTTGGGGSSNFGTIFKLSFPPSLSPTYSYLSASPTGAYPSSGLTRDRQGNLLGVLPVGGTSGVGVLYKFDRRGVFSVVRNLTGADQVYYPQGNLLIDRSGNIYGTTSQGGSFGGGTVYRIPAGGGAPAILHGFGDTTVKDGQYPIGGVTLDKAGNLWGVTSEGGANSMGTIFKISSTGTYELVHSFSGDDGEKPYGPLALDRKGVLWGTTQLGGADAPYCADGYGCGVLFKVTP